MADRVEIEIVASDKATKTIDGLQGRLSGLADSLTRTGTSLTVGVTAPLTVLGTTAVSEFGKFNEEILRAGAFVNASEEEMEMFRRAAIEAARGTSFSFEQAAAALGSFVGGEIDAQTAAEELGSVIDLALVANMEDLQSAVNLSSLAFTVFSDDGLEMTDVMDIIASVASNVTTETDAWANSLTNSAASAASAGLSFEDLNTLFAAMVRGGADVNSLWASFNAAMINVQAPSKAAEDALKSVGLSSEGMQKALAGGPIEFLEYLKQGFDEANESGQGMAFLAEVLGRQAAPEFALALGLTNSELEETAGYFSEAAGMGENMVERIRESISPLDLMKQTFSEMSLTIGQLLMPYVQQLVGWIQMAVTWFQNLSPETQNFLVIAGIAAAVLGPLLVVLGSIVGAVSALIPVISSVAAFIGGPFIAPILAVIAIIGLLWAAWQNNWGGIRDTVDRIWASLQPVFQKLRDWLGVTIPLVISALKQYWEGVLLPAIQRVWQFLQQHVFPLLRSLGNLLGTVLKLALTVLAGIWQNVLLPAITKVWEFIANRLMPKITEIANFLRATFEPAIRGIGSAFDWVRGIVDSVNNAIRGMSLPSWLKPGSPTPLEMGLRGIRKEMGALSRVELPALQSSLELSPAMPLAPAGTATGTGQGGGSGSRFVFGDITINNSMDLDAFANELRRRI